MGGEKSIKDPVHGYIVIPKEYCRLFVDTPIFQRLRLIEQTSMRWLFPGARHDRFIHSLGVFHLASRIYESIKLNVQDEEIKELLEKTNIESTFRVASLMHDCGHSPFSHTFEKYYNKNADRIIKEAEENGDVDFGDDVPRDENGDPAPYEKVRYEDEAEENQPYLNDLYQYMRRRNRELFESGQSQLDSPTAYKYPEFDLHDYGVKTESIGLLQVEKLTAVVLLKYVPSLNSTKPIDPLSRLVLTQPCNVTSFPS